MPAARGSSGVKPSSFLDSEVRVRGRRRPPPPRAREVRDVREKTLVDMMLLLIHTGEAGRDWRAAVHSDFSDTLILLRRLLEIFFVNGLVRRHIGDIFRDEFRSSSFSETRGQSIYTLFFSLSKIYSFFYAIQSIFQFLWRHRLHHFESGPRNTARQSHREAKDKEKKSMPQISSNRVYC